MICKRAVWVAVVLLSLLPAIVAESSDVIVASPETGPAPLTVDFALRSTREFVSYQWDFNGDGAADSTNAEPSYVFSAAGKYTVALTLQDSAEIETVLSKVITVVTPMAVSATAIPASGVAPLVVQFNSIATGKEPITYVWDFNSDGVADGTQQNPLKTFDQPGSFNATMKAVDADGNSVVKVIPILVTEFDSGLVLKSYYPTTLAEGENQITFLIQNAGSATVRELSARIVADGFQHLSSTSIGSLKAGEEDSLTAKVNVIKSGKLEGVVKILDKNFPVVFNVSGQVIYNKEELELQLKELKGKLQEQEAIYYDKKSEGYLVSEVFESIKSIKGELQKAQQNILTKKYADAKVSLDLVQSGVADVAESLSEVKKQKVSLGQWLKDNALTITAVVAALGT